LSVWVTSLTLACGSAPASPATAAVPAQSDALSALEARLLSAPTFRIRARLATSGRITSHFEGSVVAGDGQRIRLAMAGSLGNRDVTARWMSDGARMVGGSREASFDFDAPRALRDGLVVSFVRMGLTHQVAVLSSGKPPEYLDGRARDHLGVVGVVHGPGGSDLGVETELWTWTLVVDGKPSADEHLWLDPRTGLPLRRRLTVHFAEGDMDVAEDYDTITVDEPEPDASFALGL
jgi:hypothetical protein